MRKRKNNVHICNNIFQPQIYKNMETPMRFTYEVFVLFLFEEICGWEFEERPI
jgi:hypothetical protein